jgi:hypothetical protein
MEREILGKVRTCGGLAGTAFEIRNGDHLQMFFSIAYGQIGSSFGSRVGRGKNSAQVINLGQRIQSFAGSGGFWLRPLPRQRPLPKIRIRNSNQPRRFATRKSAQSFL